MTSCVSSNYPYKAYMNSVLKFQGQTAKPWEESEGCYPDTYMDDVDATGKQNLGLI